MFHFFRLKVDNCIIAIWIIEEIKYMTQFYINK